MMFHRNGKPRGWIRKLFFDGTQPKSYAKRLVCHRSGRPRTKFASYVNGEFLSVKDLWDERSNSENLAIKNGCFLVHAEPVPASARLLVFVAYTPLGRLSLLQRYQLQHYKDAGFCVVLVANSVGPLKVSCEDSTLCSIIMSRPNEGFDFRAWAHAIENIGGLERCTSISFTNDSIIPVSREALKKMARELDQRPEDVVFQTHNNEVKPHFQSYFFTLKKKALTRDILGFLQSMPTYYDKKDLIYKEEIYLSERLQALGLKVGAIFDSPDLMDDPDNVTIKRFDEMIDRGFPFVKVTLMTEAGFKIDDPRIQKVLAPDVREMLTEHLGLRTQKSSDHEFDPNGMSVPTYDHPSLIDRYGIQKSWNRREHSYGYLKIPLETTTLEKTLPAPSETRILAVIHCYYVDLSAYLLLKLKSLGPAAQIVLTTDTDEKAQQLSEIVAAQGMTAAIEVYENRGRDVLPFLSACQKYIGDTQAVLHLHTKKSPHDQELNDWGDYLFEALIGSEAHIASNLCILRQKDVGLVYPAHHKVISKSLNWGYNYPKTHDLLRRMNISITADQILDFPSGTMFWIRPDVLRALLDVRLQPDDFSDEVGQVDGTLAHAIERSLIFIAESCGYLSIPVVSESKTHQAWGTCMSGSRLELPSLIKRLSWSSLRSQRKASRYYDNVSEIYPVSVIPRRVDRPRFNVIIPSLKPEHIFGGISTALKMAQEIFDAMGEMDLRFIVTSTDVDRDSLNVISERFKCQVVKDRPSGDVVGVTAISTSCDRYDAVSLRKNDYFFATAWWTADLGYRLIADQKASFGTAAKLVYLIQDHEPGFYQWGDKFANAEATYSRGDETIAIINSEELANFMTERYDFPEAFCVPFEINAAIAGSLKPATKQKKIFVYGRPGTARNCFGSIVEGLRLWQSRDPQAYIDWSIVFAGESFSEKLIEELENATCLGKLSLERYADLLVESSIGISLMLSPHPSYPPLELAVAGAQTITNDYEHKNMGVRSPNIISLKSITPLSIANALNRATQLSKIGEIIPLSDVKRPSSKIQDFNAQAVARTLMFAGEVYDSTGNVDYRVELDGQSMRKTKLKTGDESAQN